MRFQLGVDTRESSTVTEWRHQAPRYLPFQDRAEFVSNRGQPCRRRARAFSAAPGIGVGVQGCAEAQHQHARIVQARTAPQGIAEDLKAKLKPTGGGGTIAIFATGEAEMAVIGANIILATPGAELVGWLPSVLQSYVVFTVASALPRRKQRLAETY
jgi:hypothetical protein